MPWVYLDDHFDEHEKVEAAGGDASWLFVAGLCFANRNLTGGRIPKTKVPRLTDRRQPERLAQRLVEVGLWEDAGDVYVIHDYDHWNRSATERAEQERRSKKASKAAQARWEKEREQTEPDAQVHAQASAEHMPEHMLKPMPHARGVGKGLPAKQEEDSPPLRLLSPPTPEPDPFDRFWAGYPRKIARPAAAKAFDRACRDAPASAIVDGLDRWCMAWRANRTPARFIPHPATWLNQERWNDPPDPAEEHTTGRRQSRQERDALGDAELEAYLRGRGALG